MTLPEENVEIHAGESPHTKSEGSSTGPRKEKKKKLMMGTSAQHLLYMYKSFTLRKMGF